MDEMSSLFDSYRAAERMEYFQWFQRRMLEMQEGALKRLVAAKSWEEARFAQGQIDALRAVIAASVPDEARI